MKMVSITTRQTQLSPLTHAQVDANFLNMKAAIESVANVPDTIFATLASTDGAKSIGFGTDTVDGVLNAMQMADYAALRAYVGPRHSAYVTGYLATVSPAGIAGMFVCDDSDTTTPDNGGTIIVSANGKRWKRRYDSAANVQWFGAKGDGVTFDVAALRAALAFGGDIYAPDGIYRLNDTVLWTVSRDTRVICAAGAVFMGDASMPVDNKLLMPATDGNLRSLTWEGGTLDGRHRPARSTGAPDLFYIADSNFRRVSISRVYFLSNDDYTGTAGDSGLFLAEGEDYHVEKCVFQGCIDAGLYISGDNTLTKGRRIHAVKNTFIYCGVGVITKRLFEDHVIDGTIVTYCGTGIVVGGEGSDTQGAGRKAVVCNSVMRHVERGIEARLADSTLVTSNRIEDFGISMAGVVVADHAIVVAGSSHCSVTSNTICLTGAYVPSSASAAVNIDVRTFNGTTYQGNNTQVVGNDIDGAYIGVKENGTCDYNNLTGNQITRATIRYAVVGAHTLYQDLDPVTGTQRTRWGSSGQANAVAGATIIHEDDTDVIFNVLTPSNKSVQFIVGNETGNAVARFGYDQTTKEWTWRAGGSGVVFGVRSDGPKFGTVTALAGETITSYVTIHDIGGTLRKIPVIS